MTLIGDPRLRGMRFEDLAIHSEKVSSGGLFAALSGSHTHGDAYVSRAIARGARVILSQAEAPPDLSNTVTWITVDSVWQDFAELAHHLAGNPCDDLCLIAVTGTNGKSTIAHALYTTLHALNYPVGLFGTVEHRFRDYVESSHHTTPELLTFLKILREMKARGARGAVLEMSSHAIEQSRLFGVHFDRAVFTNLTQDHLDHHHTMDAYFAAKARLFTTTWLKPDAIAFYNIDDPYGRLLFESNAWPRVAVFSLSAMNHVTHVQALPCAQSFASNMTVSIEGSSFDWIIELNGKTENASVTSPMIGAHNVSNLLAILSVLESLGFPRADVAAALSAYPGLRGRLERVPDGRNAIFVDYAHTPDALHHVLLALRHLLSPEHALVVVFGCGGDRDRGKRPLMGTEVAAYADRIYVTNDNPRSEDPQVIADDILAGIPDVARERVVFELSRRRAIQQAIESLRPGDVLLVAGKGHETTQTIGTHVFPFDDAAVIRECLDIRK